MARARDAWVNLARGELSALAGFCALRHLDLNLFGGGEIRPRDAKSSGGDLLDGAVAVGSEALLRLAALAGVALAAELVHRHGDALVRLFADGAIAHRARLKAADDLLHRLDFLYGNRMAFGEAKKIAQRNGRISLHPLDVFFKEGIIPRAYRGLQQVDCLGIVEMMFAILLILESAAGG